MLHVYSGRAVNERYAVIEKLKPKKGVAHRRPTHLHNKQMTMHNIHLLCIDAYMRRVELLRSGPAKSRDISDAGTPAAAQTNLQSAKEEEEESHSPQNIQKGVCCTVGGAVVRAQSNDVLYTAATEAMKRQAQIMKGRQLKRHALYRKTLLLIAAGGLL